MTYILLSFKGVFADLIYEKRKMLEVRTIKITKIIPRKSAGIIYESLPEVGKVTGMFTIGSTCFVTAKKSLKTLDFDADTRAYVESLPRDKNIFVMEVLKPIKFASRVDVRSLDGFKIPRSFRYLSNDEFKFILKHAHQGGNEKHD